MKAPQLALAARGWSGREDGSDVVLGILGHAVQKGEPGAEGSS
jgi:hypothetical protein